MIRDCHWDTRKKILEHSDLKGKRVLEIGCGAGRISQMYANDVRQIVGIEPEFEKVCSAAHTISSASFICGSGMNLPFSSDNFDVVLFTLSLHHHPDSLAALAEAQRVMAHDGLIIIIEPTTESEIQKFCKVFEDEDHRLIAVEKALLQCPLQRTSKEVFATHWEFANFADAANYAFTYYNHPPDVEKRKYLQDFLGPKAHDTPIRMTDTLQLTCLKLHR